MLRAAEAGDLHAMKRVIARGGAIESMDREDRSALHAAAQNGFVQVSIAFNVCVYLVCVTLTNSFFT